MGKNTYDQTIEKVAEKLKKYEDEDRGFGILERVDKDLGSGQGATWDASGWKDYCDFLFCDA
jgi:hypothetical protein